MFSRALSALVLVQLCENIHIVILNDKELLHVVTIVCLSNAQSMLTKRCFLQVHAQKRFLVRNFCTNKIQLLNSAEFSVSKHLIILNAVYTHIEMNDLDFQVLVGK